MNRIILSILFSLFSHTGICSEFTDWDADGIPDSIEILYGTDYQVTDSHYDLDDDNYSNLKEFYFDSDINWSGSIPGSSIDRNFLVNNDRSLHYIFYSEDWRIEENELENIKLTTEVDSASIEFRTAVKLNSIVTFTIESEAEAVQVNTYSTDVELEEISIPTNGIGTYNYAIVNGSSTKLYSQKANKADFRIFFNNDSLKKFSIATLRIYEDQDGDGSPDSKDNCPTVPNQDQSDSNLDGTGDSCEPKTGDTDGDTISDHEDNCPDTANYSQSDWDNDTIGDACDDDIDGDLLINELEILYGQEIFSRNGYLVDFPEPSFTLSDENYDGDLLPDRFEYLMGTDPFSKTAAGEKIDLYDYFPVGNISWEFTDINDTPYSPPIIKMKGSNGLYHCNNTYFPLLGTSSSSLLVKEDGIYVSDYEVDSDFYRAVKVTIDSGYEIKVLPRFLSIGQFFHYSIPCEQTSPHSRACRSLKYTIGRKVEFVYQGNVIPAVELLIEDSVNIRIVTLANGLGMVKVEQLNLEGYSGTFRQGYVAEKVTIDNLDEEVYYTGKENSAGGSVNIYQILILSILFLGPIRLVAGLTTPEGYLVQQPDSTT